jgi:hypothetical protein
MITFDRNPRSRSTGLGDHLAPESVITIDRNAQFCVRMCRFPALLSLVIQDRFPTLGATVRPQPVVAAHSLAVMNTELNDTCLKGALHLMLRRFPCFIGWCCHAGKI